MREVFLYWKSSNAPQGTGSGPALTPVNSDFQSTTKRLIMELKTSSITEHASIIKHIGTLPYPALRLIQKYLVSTMTQNPLLSNVRNELKRFVLYSNTLNPDHHSLRPSFIKDVNIIYNITMLLVCTSYDELSTQEQNYISDMADNIVQYEYLWKKN